MKTHLSESKKNYYVKIINFLRAIASLGVCAIHISYGTGLYKIKLADRFISFGQQGVPIFFVISGFIIPYSLWNSNYETKDFFRYLFKRALRIDPPYLVVILICILTGGCAFDWVKLILHVGYLIPFFKSQQWYQGVFWTLGIEFQYYVIIGLGFRFIKTNNNYLLLLILLLLPITSYFLPSNIPTGFIIKHLHYFCFGIVCCLYLKGKINFIQAHIWFGLLTLFLCISISITTGLIGYFTSLSILYLNFSTKATDFLGKISYSLYLVHIFVGGWVINFFSPYIENIFILFILTIVFCILFATVFYYLVEKPAFEYSKRYKLNK